MRQSKLDDQFDGGESKEDSKQHDDTKTSSARKDQAQEDQEAGSKRKADEQEGPQDSNIEEKHESKAARKDNGDISDLAVDTAKFNSEQRKADQELQGADVEDSKAAAQDQNSDGKISWQMTEKGLYVYNDLFFFA